MTHTPPPTTKQNVRRFDEDVREQGAYAYTGDRLSARLANARISRSIAESFDFRGASVLDLGCGDGAYTVEFPTLGVRQVVGLDPAAVAIDAADIGGPNHVSLVPSGTATNAPPSRSRVLRQSARSSAGGITPPWCMPFSRSPKPSRPIPEKRKSSKISSKISAT